MQDLGTYGSIKPKTETFYIKVKPAPKELIFCENPELSTKPKVQNLSWVRDTRL